MDRVGVPAQTEMNLVLRMGDADWQQAVQTYWKGMPCVLGSWKHTYRVLAMFPPQAGESVQFLEGQVDQARYLAVCTRLAARPRLALFRLTDRPVLIDKISTFALQDADAIMQAGIEGLQTLIAEARLRELFEEDNSDDECVIL